jgi:hypothetical protein
MKISGISGYQLGTSKVFLRAGQMAMLDKQRTEKLSAAATVMQRHTRGWLARLHYKQALVSVVRMQVRMHASLARLSRWFATNECFCRQQECHLAVLAKVPRLQDGADASSRVVFCACVYLSRAGVRAWTAGPQGDPRLAPAEGSHQHPDRMAAVQDAPAVQPSAAQHHGSPGGFG